MLTKEAWNAFLKTLEEPPPNTVFVLATTESHKVMATIADRCQRFDFQRPSLEQISEVLRRVAVAEGIEVDEGAVAMIARSASGSFRDALGTLDQLVAFGGEQVSLDAVLELLGAADAELLFDAVDAVVAEDPKAVLLEVEKMARSGRDPAQFARDLLAHLRHLLVTQTDRRGAQHLRRHRDRLRPPRRTGHRDQRRDPGPNHRRAGGRPDRRPRGRRRPHGSRDRPPESSPPRP